MMTKTMVMALMALACATAVGQVREGGAVDWNRYYSNAESNQIMAAWVERYPDLARLETIGKSYLGTDLTLIEITNRKTGAPEEKPAYYVDGSIHSRELTSGAAVLYFAGYLLERYGVDPEVTALLDTRTFYVRPKFNPDGADAVLLDGASLRSTVRPVDEDEDGVADEDPADDVNGDGFVTEMRIPDPDGDFKLGADDPRLLVRREEGDTEGPFYRVVSEGIDGDGDGELNEDGLGGLDMNRNFPRNWALPAIQPGAGPFPLSEPETHATVRFIVDHPNITGILHNHTPGGFVYRLPSASDPSAFDTHDLDLVKTLGAKFTELTGREVRPSATHPTKHRYGTLISWAYWDRGIIGWVPELWPGIGEGALDALRYDDEHLGGRYFIEWTPFDHPTLGPVEIGGFRSIFMRNNPPPELLAAECALHVPWFLWLAQQSPRIELAAPTLETLADGTVAVSVVIRNAGVLPTHLTRRGLESQVQRPVVARIELEGATLASGAKRIAVGHLRGSYDLPGAAESPSATVRWIVRPTGPGATVRVVAESDTGGTVRSAAVRLGGGR